MSRARILLLLIVMAFVAACQPASPPPDATGITDASQQPQEEAVERYIIAKSNSERETMQGLICSALESTLDAEAMSFSGIENEVVEMDCLYNETEGTVTCEGAIVAVYNGENTEFPLGTYNVVEEDGEWKWCGEA